MPVDIVSLVSVLSSSFISIISQIQNSRCTKINFCGIKCDRSITKENEEREIE